LKQAKKTRSNKQAIKFTELSLGITPVSALIYLFIYSTKTKNAKRRLRCNLHLWWPQPAGVARCGAAQ
jgi:hypothetical protein